MNERDYFMLSAIIFLIGTVLHAIRVLGNYSLEYGNKCLPIAISILIVLVGIFMVYYGFKFKNKMPKRTTRLKGRKRR